MAGVGGNKKPKTSLGLAGLRTQKDVWPSPEKHGSRHVLPEKISAVLGSSGGDSEAPISLDQEKGGWNAKHFPSEKFGCEEKKQNIVFPHWDQPQLLVSLDNNFLGGNTLGWVFPGKQGRAAETLTLPSLRSWSDNPQHRRELHFFSQCWALQKAPYEDLVPAIRMLNERDI